MTNDTENLKSLIAERDIKQTMYRYGSALDYGCESDWLNCWISDAFLHWPDQPIRGHGELLAAFNSHTHAPSIYHKHIVVNIQISVVGDSASAQSNFMRVDAYDDGPQIMAFGRYVDNFILCDDAVWRFSKRVVELESVRTPPAAVLQAMAMA